MPFKRTLMTASALSLTLALSGCFHESLFGGNTGDNCAAGETCSVNDVNSFDQEVKTDKVSAKLSGVVQLTNTSGAFAKPGVPRKPAFAADVSGQTLAGTPAPKTLILAVDAWGNTISDQADSVGGFDMDLDAGKLYAVIFIDTRTMEVLGSLVQAANTENAAAVALADNTNLGNVVIDPVSGRAVAEADATPDSVTQEEGVSVKVVDASELDSNGDGMVTQDDITALQAKALEDALAGGESKIKKLSPLNFMGDRNTWVAMTEARKESWSHSYTDGNNQQITESFDGDVSEGRFSIVREKQVDGPNGGQVTALKHADLTYMRKESGTRTGPQYNPDGTTTIVTDSNYVWGGYYNGLIAKINADWDGSKFTEASLTASGDWAKLPLECQNQIHDRDTTVGTGPSWGVWCGDPFSGTTFNAINPKMDFTWETGLWAWARYQYADQENGVIVEGEWDHENRKVAWNDQGGIPLELELGQSVTDSHTESWSDPATNTTYEVAMSYSFTPKLVDGVMVDTLGRKLPIIRIDMVGGTVTYKENGVEMPLPAEMANNMPDFKSESMYILAKYGAEAPAYDAAGVEIPWQQAFKDVRFGLISRAVTAADANTVLADRCGGTTADKAILEMSPVDKLDRNLIICKTSPESVALADGTSVDMSGAMPGGVGTPDARNTWLAFLARNINQLEVVDYNNFQNVAGDPNAQQSNDAWFWVEQNEQTWSGVEPLNWDPVNYLNYPLTAGTAQEFVTTKNPDTTVGGEDTTVDTGADVNVHYSGTGVSFAMQLRVWDPKATDANNPTMVGMEVPLGETSTPVSVADVDPATYAGGESVISLSTSINIPALSKTSAAYPESWTFWEPDTTGTGAGNTYCAAGASLWLIMYKSDPNNPTAAPMEVMSQPIGWYDIRGDKLAAGDNCDKFAQ